MENIAKILNTCKNFYLLATRGGPFFPELDTVCFFLLFRLGGPPRGKISLYGRRGVFLERVFLPGGDFFRDSARSSKMRRSGGGLMVLHRVPLCSNVVIRAASASDESVKTRSGKCISPVVCRSRSTGSEGQLPGKIDFFPIHFVGI